MADLKEVFEAHFEVLRDAIKTDLLQHVAQKLPAAFDRAIEIHGPLEPRQAFETGYLMAMHDALQQFDLGPELIDAVLEAFAEQSN